MTRLTTSEVCIGCLGLDQKAGYDVCGECLHRLRFAHDRPGLDYRNDNTLETTFNFQAWRREMKELRERRRRRECPD